MVESPDNCVIFGDRSVPWCASEWKAPIPPERLFKLEDEGVIRIPTLVPWTGTGQKVRQLVSVVEMIIAKNPEKYQIGTIVPFNKIDLGEEPDWRWGGEIVESKGAVGMDRFVDKYVLGKEMLQCFTTGQCWKFPMFIFNDVKVSLSGSCSGKPKEHVHKLRTELEKEYGDEWRSVGNSVEAMTKHLTNRYQNLFTDDEHVVVSLDAGVLATRFDDKNENKQIEKGEYLVWRATSRAKYVLPATLLRNEAFIDKYLKQIEEERGNIRDIFNVPMGLFVERIVELARSWDGGKWVEQISYEAPESEYDLSLEDRVLGHALGFPVDAVAQVLEMTETKPNGNGKSVSRAKKG